MKKDPSLNYLPPRQLFVSSRGIPSVTLYIFGLGVLFLSVILHGHMNPLAMRQKSFFDAYEWPLFAVSFALCCLGPLNAPVILRHRFMLLLFGVLGFLAWAAFCGFLYLTIFGSWSEFPKEPARGMY